MQNKHKTRPVIKTKYNCCPTCGHQIALDERQIGAMLDQVPPRAFIRAKLLLRFLPISEATLWRRVACGKFPKPVKLSQRITGWRVEDVRKWMMENGLI